MNQTFRSFNLVRLVEILNLQVHIRFFKSFNILHYISALVSAYNEGINPSAHLKSVICQLDFLPKFALANEVSSLVPLLAKGLSSDGDENLIEATLVSLRDIFNQVKKLF